MRLFLPVPLALTAVLASLALAAPAGAAPATVTVGSDFFNAKDVTVNTGETVTWNWQSGTHNVAFKTGPVSIGTSPWNSKGATWSATFSKPGTYTYVCEAHSSMKGTVTVVDAPAAGPAPSSGAPDPSSSAPQPVTGPTATPVAGTAGAVDTAPPTVRRVSYKRNVLRLRLSEAAKLELRYVRVSRRGHVVETKSVGVSSGDNVIALRRWMHPGRYRVSVLAFDAAGNASKPMRLKLRVRR
jgi:plastocyanin